MSGRSRRIVIPRRGDPLRAPVRLESVSDGHIPAPDGSVGSARGVIPLPCGVGIILGPDGRVVGFGTPRADASGNGPIPCTYVAIEELRLENQKLRRSVEELWAAVSRVQLLARCPQCVGPAARVRNCLPSLAVGSGSDGVRAEVRAEGDEGGQRDLPSDGAGAHPGCVVGDVDKSKGAP